MAGVMTPHASTKQGEPSEQRGDEVTHIYAIAFFYSTLMHDTSGVGNVLYRVETASMTHSHDTSAPYCNRPPLHSKLVHQVIPPSNDLDWQWYVLCSSSFLGTMTIFSHIRSTLVIHPVGNIILTRLSDNPLALHATLWVPVSSPTGIHEVPYCRPQPPSSGR